MAQPKPLTLDELFLMAETVFGLTEDQWLRVQYAFMVVIGNQQSGLYKGGPYEFIYNGYDDVARIVVRADSKFSVLDDVLNIVLFLCRLHLGASFDTDLHRNALGPKVKAWHGKLGLLKEEHNAKSRTSSAAKTIDPELLRVVQLGPSLEEAADIEARRQFAIEQKLEELRLHSRKITITREDASRLMKMQSEARSKADEEASKLLENKPDYPRVGSAIFDRFEAEKIGEIRYTTEPGSSGRLAAAKKAFDIRAEELLLLVDDIHSHKAYVKALGHMTRVAMEEYTDIPHAEINFRSPEVQETFNQFVTKARQWENKGLKRLIPAKANTKKRSSGARTARAKPTTPAKLAADYFDQFPEKIKKLDVCWAAGEHYREWKRWINNHCSPGSKPDRSFRAILASGKRPLEYRLEPRPPKWS